MTPGYVSAFPKPADRRDEPPPHPGSDQSRPAKRFDLIPFRDVTFTPGRKWLVKGLLASTGLATIFGPPKQYKSFVALDVGLHVASGTAWAGRRVQQGAVVYIVAEGATGFTDRVAANHQKHGLPDDLPFYLIKAKPNLGAAEGDTGALIAAIEPVIADLGIRLAAIFIDTLVRTLAGSSENDEGMRNFTDNAEVIADHFGCLCCAIHHSGKDVAKGMRGSSALHGAVVSSWKVEKSRDFQARVVLEDAKDGESGLTWTVDLERYIHGMDEDGDEESVLIVAAVSEPVPEDQVGTGPASGAKSQTLPPQLRLFMACLDAMIGSVGRTAKPFLDGPMIRVVPSQAVKDEYFARRGDDVSRDAKRKAFDHCTKTALDRRLVLVETADDEKVMWRARPD